MFRRKHKVAELEAHVKQLSEYVERFRQERDLLAKRLEVIEWRLKALIKVYFPSRFHNGLSAEECITILSKGLQHVAEVLAKAKSMPSPEGSERIESRGERERVYERLERLDDELKEALKHALLGYCTVNSLAKVLSISSHKAKVMLSSLVGSGWLDALKVKPLRRGEAFDIYFPSPYGLIACEKLLNASWTFAQAQHLKELKQFISDEELIDMAKERLKHAHEHVVSVKEDPTQCLIRYTEGSHKADLLIDGKYVECESLANDLEQTLRMCRALHEAQGEVIVIVPSTHAIRMMLQRLCLASWRLGYSLKVRIAHVNELSHLDAMRKYIILRPPKKVQR
ncbi:MAG: hypothetical protein DRN15_08815 [Thermoprotei archaeon]|nr:MAG: hypothetical protein DRN15_08815 [Thermoprotei archaeon]